MRLLLALLLVLFAVTPALAQGQSPDDRYDETRATAGAFLQEAARCALQLRAEQRRSQALTEELTKLKAAPAPEKPKPEAK